MSRVPLTDPDKLVGFARTLYDTADETAPVQPTIAQAFAPAPELLESFWDWAYPWHGNHGERQVLPARVKELCRLRLASFSGCKACKSSRTAVDVVSESDALGVDTERAEAFLPEEKAALQFAEKFAIDHHSIDDADFAALREHFDDAQVLELVMMTGVIYVGFQRALSVMALDNPSCAMPPLYFEESAR